MFRGFNRQRIMEVCKDCSERHLACHDSCERFRAAKQDLEDRKAAIRKSKQLALEHDLYKLDAVKKIRNKH